MEKLVFVVMPIGGIETASDKLRIVKEVANEQRWSAHLPSYNPDAPVFNLNETIREMRASSLVVADLTAERPSCYYELGLAEALRLPVFAIAEKHTDIHQTSIRGEVRTYETIEEFRQLIKRALAAH
ncbi:hypothetical protein GCM10011360_16630 [Primorskyibacter flagellatus]|uniref:Nucleoside 2-deoxyribosyltransferase n=1 Tax=Primorskyibacter flagellatus TaxID=1387277 RepID=A0A917EG09_9RHOB|nr:hypothetical protein [Primorskyibacter flagellatus]GGE29196.1 hypothetical protein GCM10011360_16630 [Primorskyibacter flagellatus]